MCGSDMSKKALPHYGFDQTPPDVLERDDKDVRHRIQFLYNIYKFINGRDPRAKMPRDDWKRYVGYKSRLSGIEDRKQKVKDLEAIVMRGIENKRASEAELEVVTGRNAD